MSEPVGSDEIESPDCGCGMGDKCQYDDYLRDPSVTASRERET